MLKLKVRTHGYESTMDTPLSISKIHESVCLSVPYDMVAITQAFYTHYATLPCEGPSIWGENLTKQQRYMTITEAFTLLSLLTRDMYERAAILDRMIGHICSRCSVSYDQIYAGAHAIYEKNI